jgi:hypothetical protein
MGVQENRRWMKRFERKLWKGFLVRNHNTYPYFPEYRNKLNLLTTIYSHFTVERQAITMEVVIPETPGCVCKAWIIWLEYSPDYPTFGYPTFRFIRRAVSERSILSTVTSACNRMNHSPPPRTFYILCTQLLLFWRWRDLAAKKRKEAQKQIPNTNFLKNKLFHLHIYIMFFTVCVCEIFSFDTVLYFLRNLITS